MAVALELTILKPISDHYGQVGGQVPKNCWAPEQAIRLWDLAVHMAATDFYRGGLNASPN
jgi:hypothetical protein